MNVVLYLAVAFIWGSTWLAIAMQQGEVPNLVSIFYRFAIATALMFILTIAKRRLQRLSLKDHLFCLLQGITIFCCNFYCAYQAATYISSGLESVLFSTAVIFNALNSMLFFRQKQNPNLIPAAFCGIAGITILFLPDLLNTSVAGNSLVGIILCVTGAYCFSLGNMLSIRHQRNKLDIFTTNSYAMLYGTIALAIISLVQGLSFTPDFSIRYMGSLFYLSIFGSVIAFAAYFTLIGRIGASQAAYSTLLSPLIALILSTIFENYQWKLNAFVGLGLILLGNLIMFSRINLLSFLKKRSPATSETV